MTDKRMEAQQAIDVLLNIVKPVETETVPLADALGRVLAEDMIAEYDIPPFDRSPFDGYALRGEETADATTDHPVVFSVTEDIPCGSMPTMPVGKGQAGKVSTGAPMPEGTNTVIKYEETRFDEKTVSVFSYEKPGKSIIYRGEDAERGQLLAPKGTVVTPAYMGVLAGQGFASLRVYRPVTVSVLNTGSELVQPGDPLPEGKIYNSNFYTIRGLLQTMNVEVRDAGLVQDDLDTITDMVSSLLEESDMVITTGGASVGDYDWALRSAEKMGARVLFCGAKIKPGGSFVTSEKNGKIIMSLSGNPGAAVDGLLKIGLPCIRRLCGYENVMPRTMELFMESDFRKTSDRLRLVRGKRIFHGGKVWFRAASADRNSRLSPLVGCDVIVEIPPDAEPPKKGDLVHGFLVYETEEG